MQSYWLGRDQELQDITMKIALDTGIVDHARIKELYSYVIGRAYPYDGPAFIKPVQMPPPPVDLIARAFRETKGGKFNDDSSDLGRISPVWSAIRSSLSAVKSAIEVSRRTSLGWVHGIQPVFYGLDDFKRSAAFSLDAQLLRYCFYYPFITLNSKLWHLREDKLEEVNSVRLYVSTIEHESSYVDIIHEGSVEQYIDSMISHFDKNSRRSITGLWKMIDELGWAPGKEEEAFGKILGLSHDVVVK